ncbi:sugar transferase [uncultured Streptomyces sp.]|uniref:sugar transferase n=1 Tax=uncultured Streptomyces sp. TaxID=174707 RepID=UPI0026306446|nr:sugar transferase [uncultured Streptomyces sp.]
MQNARRHHRHNGVVRHRNLTGDAWEWRPAGARVRPYVTRGRYRLRPRPCPPGGFVHTAHAVRDTVAAALCPDRRSATAKRLLDLALGSLLLLLASPALVCAALVLAVRRTPGGVRDGRIRVGLHGRTFLLRRLRTRRFRLDVLSALPHVVRGEMSLVGPAPLPPRHPRATPPAGARPWRQELRPGLTDPARTRVRTGMSWDEPALLEQHYAEHRTMGLDLAILAGAARAGLLPALRRAARGARGTKADLSDTDHRPPGYALAE